MENKVPTCQKHSKKEKLWCINCKGGVCVLCVINHNKKGHKLVHPEEIISGNTNDLHQFEEQITEFQTILKNSDQTLNQIHDELKENQQKQKSELTENIERIIQKLQDLKNDLLSQYEENYFDVAVQQIENLHDAIDKQNQRLREVQDQVDNCSSSDKNNVKQVDHFINSNMKDILQSQLEEIGSKVKYLELELDEFKPGHPSFNLVPEESEFGKMVNAQFPSPDNLEEIFEGLKSAAAPPAARRLNPKKVNWSLNRKSKHMEILSDGQLIQKQKSYFGWASAAVDHCIEGGQAFITFQVEQAGKEGFADVYIGLCQKEANIKFDGECLNGYGQNSVWALNRNGDFYEPKRGCISTNKEERKFANGDVINVAVNMVKKYANFSLNGKEVFSISDLSSQIFPYVCLGGINQSVSIQNFYIS